jgi:hypothetical protein
MAKNLQVQCPCCSTRLTVDGDTGMILAEERPKITERVSFDEAVREVHESADKREQAFSQAYDRTQKRDDLLDRMFEEARKKAARDPSTKPKNPLDFD